MIIYFIENVDTLEISDVRKLENPEKTDEWEKITGNCSLSLWEEYGYLWDNIGMDGSKYVEWILDTEKYENREFCNRLLSKIK